MKLVVLLVACLTVCAAHVVPTVPGDNSHYVEGESRYIWMSDDPDTEPVLVDLHEPVDTALLNDATRNGANNQYWLFTRRNPTSAQVLVNGNANSVHNSNFVAPRPIKVIVHGWNSNGNTAMNPEITAAMLSREDANVIVVDWRALANSNYLTAANGVPSVGQHLGNFLIWLLNLTGGNWNNVHLVGFSLGAHVVGNAGRTTSGRCSRVTGLDPAGPNWGSSSQRLTPADGRHVEAIHTDTALGINTQIANADFFPNGGRNQPGCLISTCSHGRATKLFESTVYTNHLVGQQCSNVNAAQSGSCTGSGRLNMGNHVINKSGNGIFHLTTRNVWPF